jgi:hypothetical protein
VASLGSLGNRRPTIDLDFDWFGHTVRVNPHASDLVEIDFLEKAKSIDMEGIDTNALTAENMAAMSRAAQVAADAAIGSVRRVIHPDDWDGFWKAAIDNGQNLEDLLELQKTIVEAVANFRTGQSSDSSPGPVTTPAKFEVDLPSPALSPEAARSLARLETRPDLQVAILRAEEARNGALASA